MKRLTALLLALGMVILVPSAAHAGNKRKRQRRAIAIHTDGVSAKIEVIPVGTKQDKSKKKRLKARSPAKLKLPFGSYKLVARAKGYHPSMGVLHVRRDSLLRRLDLTLIKK